MHTQTHHNNKQKNDYLKKNEIIIIINIYTNIPTKIVCNHQILHIRIFILIGRFTNTRATYYIYINNNSYKNRNNDSMNERTTTTETIDYETIYPRIQCTKTFVEERRRQEKTTTTEIQFLCTIFGHTHKQWKFYTWYLVCHKTREYTKKIYFRLLSCIF